MLPALNPSDFIQKQDQQLMTAEMLGKQLGYSDPGKQVRRLYARHKDELQDFEYSGKLTLYSKVGRPALLFNVYGCMLITILANTPAAKIFRRELIIYAEKCYREEKVKSQKYDNLEQQTRIMRMELATIKLDRLFEKNINFSRKDFECLLKVQHYLSRKRLARTFEISTSTILKYLKLHRHSEGNFEETQPAALRAYQQKSITSQTSFPGWEAVSN